MGKGQNINEPYDLSHDKILTDEELLLMNEHRKVS